MKIVSCYDGMACGYISFKELGIQIDEYIASEVDKYAIQTATHNFPDIVEVGDIFNVDFTQYRGADFVIGGSPCTYWSIAQKKNRETTPDGIGGKLFLQFERVIIEVQPKYFIYENNKSMSNTIKEFISQHFGFEPICINSALVSAQNRQRYYWVGKRNEDGTYSKVDVQQPEDRGILLKDILETGDSPLNTSNEGKSFCVAATEGRGTNPQLTLEKHRRTMVCEPICVADEGKAVALKSQYYKNGIANFAVHSTAYGFKSTGVAEPVRIPDYGTDKARPLNAYYPNNCGGFEHRIWNENPAKQQVDLIADPLTVKEATKKGYTEIEQGDCVDMTQPNSKTRRGRSMKDKCNCLTTSPQYYQYLGCAVFSPPHGWNEGIITYDKAPTLTTGSQIRQQNVLITTYHGEKVKDPKAFINKVYKVENGLITIKEKQYPIKLIDGYYIIRKLTVKECMRLQTVPEWYEFPVSNTQAYKMLGNGWTIEVIKHLIKACLESED